MKEISLFDVPVGIYDRMKNEFLGEERGIQWERGKTVRNVAIIAHWITEKTTLVDSLKNSGLFRENHGSRAVMDSDAIERGAGITDIVEKYGDRYKGIKLTLSILPTR